MAGLQEFWKERVDWKQVEKVLSQYPKTAEIFPVSSLKRYEEIGPFYIHPLTRWLMVGGDIYSRALTFLSSNIERLEKLEGWDKKKPVFSSGQDSDRFWSDLSEIKTAVALLDLGYEVEMLEADNQPDLRATKEKVALCVEVYMFRKFFYRLFELEQAVEALNFEFRGVLNKHGASLSLERHIGIPTSFTDEQFIKLLDTAKTFIENEDNVAKVEEEYPQVVFQEGQNFQLVLNGNDASKYAPGRSLSSGNFDGYMEQMLEEILANKKQFGQLSGCEGIKLGVVDVLLNRDMQTAPSLTNGKSVELPPEVDALVFLATSIDEALNFKAGQYLVERNQSNLEKALALK